MFTYGKLQMLCLADTQFIRESERIQNLFSNTIKLNLKLKQLKSIKIAIFPNRMTGA